MAVKRLLFVMEWPAQGLDQIIHQALIEFSGYEVSFINIAHAPYRFPGHANAKARCTHVFQKHFLGQNAKNLHAAHHVLNKLKKEALRYDLMILGRPDLLGLAFVQTARHFTQRLVAHYWDAVSAIPSLLPLAPYFDHVYSFDPFDSLQYGFTLLPSFYWRNNRPLLEAPLQGVYSISGITDQRLMALNLIAEKLEQLGQPYIFKALGQFESPYIETLKQSISYLTMLDEIMPMFALLDLQRGHWAGLSMRCFEALGLQKKLITNNSDIRHYDFYHPNNILIVDEYYELPASFFSTPYQALPEKIYRRYSIEHWVRTLCSH